MNGLEFTAGGRRWRADVTAPADLAIMLEFNGVQPSFFVATPASSEPLRIGGFTGSVADGASCNCAVHSLAPHCHGTHTECVGHVTRSPVTIASLTPVAPCLALLITNIETQLPPVFERFWSNPEHTACRNCGSVLKK